MNRFILLSLLICLASCEKKQKTVAPPAPIVQLDKATQEMMPYILQTIGNTAAYATVNIRPQVNGQVTGYYFQDGGFVKKGDLLYTIDSDPYEAQLEQAQGLFQQAKASLEFNTQRVERYKGLLPDDYVSILNFIQYESDKEQAQGQVIEYEGNIKSAEINLNYCTIFAPFNGRCGKHLVDPGNIVSIDQDQPLVVINQITPIYSYFTLAERFFPQLQKYNKGGLPVHMRVVGDEEHTHRGWLDFVNNTVDSKSGTIQLRGIFDNEDLLLWPGQFVDVRIILYEIPDAIVVPDTAVQRDTKGPFIYVANTKDQTVEQRRVKLGQLIDQKQVVSEGIKSGETVVISGQLDLSPGSKYQLKEESKKAT